MNENSMNNAVTMRPGRGVSLGRIDQYELIRELGGGGFGCVYLAKDTVAGIEVAVKGLPPLVRLNKEELENVRKNFALVSRLHHPNIAAALHLQKVEKAFYDDKADAEKLRVFGGDTLVVMQYAPGVTLSQWRKQFPDGKVPLDKALEIMRQIASALDYAHKEKILHRDIKPANVMIETCADGSLTARVLDFGLAAEIRSSMSRVSQSITDTSGTRPYMAPEQWLGEDQGKETDLYALAVLFNELVTGKVPFASVFDTGDPVLMMNVVGNREFNPPSDLSKPIRFALTKALSKKREDRFASCIEFVDALQGGVISGARASSRAFFSRAFIFTAVAALGLAIGGVWYWQSEKAKEEARIVAKAEAEERARKAEIARIAAEKKAEEERQAHDELVHKASTEGSKDIVINITRDDILVLNGCEVNHSDLGVRLSAISKKYPSQTILIRADQFAKYELLTMVMDTCRKVGNLNFSISTIDKEDSVDGYGSKVYGKKHNEYEKVQLWEGGPYWADRNIGAEKPEDPGYYFWWGDTVGYKRDGDKWVASDESRSNFSFNGDNILIKTVDKSISQLESEGWIEEKNGTHVLTSKHDAARAHWGGNWRMPTDKEFAGLCSKCDWIRTTKNGVYGYIVRGKSNYSTKSIFLPCAGYGRGTSLGDSGSDGCYWSSVPNSGNDYCAWYLYFGSSYHRTYDDGRYYGLTVRPVQGFTK